MKQFLKAEYAFHSFPLWTADPRFDNFDVRKFYKSLEIDYSPDIHDYRLRAIDYQKQSCYDKLPRCCRFYISESKFRNYTFSFFDFYSWEEIEENVTLDYCQKMLKRFPNHKKTTKILKKLKQDNPELLI